MQNKRRQFLKLAGLTGMGVAGGGMLKVFATEKNNDNKPNNNFSNTAAVKNNGFNQKEISIIGLYGAWASSLNQNKLPSFSYRRNEWKNLESWRKASKQRLTERLAIPDIGGIPEVNVNKQYSYDGLHIEEISWQLPYGRPTEAILLKPLNAKGKLPGVLAFHDHGGNKYFGCRKITKTSDDQHPLMKEHQQVYYSNLAWANEIAKRGYVVMVPDAFTFASRRVMFQDVPEHMRNGRNDENPENSDNIKAYNDWAGEHEHVMAKSLFCAGTT